MPAIIVNKSQFIEKPVDEVYASVRDFKQWPAWSPWLIMERGCSLVYADDGKSYSWEGKVVGSGEMHIIAESENHSINYDLRFLKPWKSQADVQFSFAEKDGGTEVTWSMNSKMPIMMFWMTKMMTAFVGMDYERGLSMLKDHVETGSVPSKVDITGKTAFSGLSYVGVQRSCPIEEVGPSMQEDMTKLGEWGKEAAIVPAGLPFAIYKKWDMVNRQTTYILGAQLASVPNDIPAGFVSGEIPPGDVFQIRHTGPYRHLGNAWSTGYAYSRAKVFKEDKKGPHFEIYEGDPMETPENDLVTVLYFPVKG